MGLSADEFKKLVPLFYLASPQKWAADLSRTGEIIKSLGDYNLQDLLDHRVQEMADALDENAKWLIRELAARIDSE
jgi:hypothetical protein